MDPLDETAWAQVIGNPIGVRSIFTSTDLVSLNLVSTGNIIKVLVDRVPFGEFNLHPFEYSGIDLNRHEFHFDLWLTDTAAVGDVSASAVFLMKWKSFYRRSDGSYKFTYRPMSIFVYVPVLPSIVPEGIPVDLKPSSEVIFLPYSRSKLLPVLQTLKENSLSKRSVQAVGKSLPRPVKSGFGGPSPRPDVLVDEPAYIAVFRSAGPSYYSEDGRIASFQKIAVRTRTPGFGKLRKALLPVNPYKVQVIRTHDGGMASFTSLSGIPGSYIRSYQTRSQGTRFPNLGQPGFDSNLYNKTLYKVQDKSGSSIQANIAQDVAQLGQLKALVASTTKKIASSIKHVKQGQFYQAALDLLDHAGPAKNISQNMSLQKSVASNWLALQYAWKPLMQDVEGLLQTLAQTVVGRPLVYTVRASSRKTVNERKNMGPFPGSFKPDIFYEYRYTYRCTIGVRYTVPNQFISVAQQLGFTNPINLAWEVLPYSFVADWFLPIGPALSSLTAWQGLSFKDGFVTQSVQREFSSAFDVTFFNTVQNVMNTEKASLSQSWFRMERSILSDFPYADIPRPKDPTSLVHALNGLALVQARFR